MSSGAPKLAAAISATLLLFSSTPATAHSESDVDHARVDRDTAYRLVERTQSQLEQALETYDKVHTQLDDVEDRIKKTQRVLTTYQSDAEILAERARRSVVEAYTSSGYDDLSARLDVSGIEDLVMIAYVGGRVQALQQIEMNRLSSVTSRVEDLNEDLAEDEQRVAGLANSAAEASLNIQASLDEAQHEMKDAEARYKGIKAEFEAEQRRKREAELARIRASANPATRGLPPAITEGFQCPVQGGAAFINSWGFPRSGGRTHKGVDMFAKRGTPTPAVTTGTVKMRTVNLGGTVAYLYGDDGNKYYYAHLNGYPSGLREGQRVERGQPIGYVGNSGNAEGTSPHLHFEIRPGGGAAVNPYPTVRPACR